AVEIDWTRVLRSVRPLSRVRGSRSTRWHRRTVLARITPSSYHDDMARRLDRLAQAEYVQRYGGPDDAPIDVSDFVAPNGGYFLAVDSAGEPLGSGAWRVLGD